MGILKYGQKKFLSLVKFKKSVPWTYMISDLNGEPITGIFHEKRIAKNKLRKI